MHVIFERVDARRYRIGVVRDGRHDVGPDVAPRSAPGHAGVPHDLVHFVVEEQAELRLGIYGQVAAGCTAGFFVAAPGERSKVQDQKRLRRIGHAGRPDVELSERLAALVDGEGRLHVDPSAAPLTPRTWRAIDQRLAEVLGQWAQVPAGDRLVLRWPDALTIRNGVLPSRPVRAG